MGASLFHLPLEFGPRLFHCGPRLIHRVAHLLPRPVHLLAHSARMLFHRAPEFPTCLVERIFHRLTSRTVLRL